MHLRSLSLSLVLLMVFVTSAAAGKPRNGKPRTGKGVIRGVVTFVGAEPPRHVVDRAADPVCAEAPLPVPPIAYEDSLGLKDVYVRIKNGTMGKHAAPAAPVVIGQNGCAYLPRVVGVVEGGTLEIRNSDPTFHNVRGNHDGQVAFNLAQNRGATPIMRDDIGPADSVLALRCDVHPWMEGWALVSDHPWFAVTRSPRR